MDNPPAWHPDPTGQHDHRWWDGENWTEHVADAGVAAIDPLDAASGPADPTVDAAGPGAREGSGRAGREDTARIPTTDRSQDHGAGGSWSQGGSGSWSQDGGFWQQAPDTQAGSGTDGVAIAAMVVGILSLLVSWIPFLGILGGLGGIVALILGFVARGRVRSGPRGGAGQAVTGIVTGALAILLSILVTVGFVRLLGGNLGEAFSDYNECVEQTGDEELCRRQLEDGLLGRTDG